jgi:MFS transporter, DHA2 family, multidrug resistance protein
MLMSKIEPRKLLASGLIIASYSIYQLSKLNLNAGYWDIFWPQLLQGISMGLLFVPLTTITNGPIPKEQMGNATSLFNLMRNIGASIGIASVTTLVSRHSQVHASTLAEHVNAANPAAMAMLDAARQAMISAGMDITTATTQAYAIVSGTLQRQAAMQAYVDTFFLLAILFIAVMPLILIMQRPSKQSGGPGMMH